MYLILLCLLSSGVRSYGTIYKLPSIYTPISNDNSPLTYFAPTQPLFQLSPQPSSLFSYSPSPYQQFLPNSFMLVYYRTKSQLPMQTDGIGQTQSTQLLTNICKSEGITANPNDCYKFIRCRLSQSQQFFTYEERTCPQGLAFDSTLESCNYQSQVINCPKVANSRRPSPTKTKTKSPLPTKTLLTYHGDFPESFKNSENIDFASNEEPLSNPSLYMLDLEQPALSLDDTPKQEHGIDHDVNASTVSVSTVKSEKEITSSTQVVKKTPTGSQKNTTKVSTTRKVNAKSPVKSTKSKAASNKSPVQQAKVTESSKKQAKVETFAIDDSDESAKLMMAPNSDAKEDTADVAVNSKTGGIEGPSGDQLAAGVTYEAESSEGDNETSGISPPRA